MMHADKIAAVSGGCSGIGLAAVMRLLGDGCKVVIADLHLPKNVPELQLAENLIESPACDLSDPDSISVWHDHLEGLNVQPDIFVHSAGLYPATPFATVTLEEWRKIFSVNLEGFFLLSQRLLPHMTSQGWGRLIGIASNTFHDGTPGLVPYVASKGGLIGMVRSLATEVGQHGITVNAVSPGITNTPTLRRQMDDEVIKHFTSLQAIPRLAVPADYAGVISFLASEDSAFMTGQTLVVDGGWTHV
tara:strand:+ start:38043 stop:38780 length:738 start_codon:yes stop_codon:yes gene_type:complete